MAQGQEGVCSVSLHRNILFCITFYGLQSIFSSLSCWALFSISAQNIVFLDWMTPVPAICLSFCPANPFQHVSTLTYCPVYHVLLQPYPTQAAELWGSIPELFHLEGWLSPLMAIFPVAQTASGQGRQIISGKRAVWLKACSPK